MGELRRDLRLLGDSRALRLWLVSEPERTSEHRDNGGQSYHDRPEATGFIRLNGLQIKRRARCMIATIHLPWLRSVSSAGGFDEACGFATLLAGIRIFDELK
jgi:hypothetical protein